MDGNNNLYNFPGQDFDNGSKAKATLQVHWLPPTSRPRRALSHAEWQNWLREEELRVKQLELESSRRRQPEGHHYAVYAKQGQQGSCQNHTLDAARPMSRPELVVEGLQEMCHLVEGSEPENPRFSCNWGHQHSAIELTSPPLPPPTAFDPGLIATREIFSNIVVSTDPPEDGAEIVRSRRSSYHKKVVASPRRSLRNVQSSHVDVDPVDDAKICEVLQSMIHQLDGAPDEEKSPVHGTRSGCSDTVSSIGTMSSVGSQLNATSSTSSDGSFRCLENGDSIEGYFECQDDQEYCPPPPPLYYTSSQETSPKLDINQNYIAADPYIQPKPRVWTTLAPSPCVRDGVQYNHQQPGFTPRMKKLQQAQDCPNSFSCQCDISNSDSKGTSTSDVPRPTSARGVHCAMSFAVMTQPQPISDPDGDPKQQQPQPGHTRYPMTPTNGCSTLVTADADGSPNGQQSVPVYILQSNQQMPIFLVQNGGNPGLGQRQAPLVFHQVQYQECPQNVNSNQTTPEQGPTGKVNRAQTRTLLQSDKESASDLKPKTSSSIIKYLNKKPGQTRLPSKTRNNPTLIVEGEEAAHPTFIVGPAPTTLHHEFEVQTLHQREACNLRKKQGTQLKPRPSTIHPQQEHPHNRNGEPFSYSDTQVYRAQGPTKGQHLEQDQEQFVQDKGDCGHPEGNDETEEQAVTPTTSTHTVVLIDAQGTFIRPCIPCPDHDEKNEDQNDQNEEQDEDEDEESYYDLECTLDNYEPPDLLEAEALSEPLLPRQSVTRTLTRDGDPKSKYRDIAVGDAAKKRYISLRHHQKSKRGKKLESKKLQCKEKEVVSRGVGEEPVEIFTPSFLKDNKGVVSARENESFLDKSVEDGITFIEDTASWEKNIFGLRIISLQVQYHEKDVLDRLPCLVALIQRHIRASGSKLARQAILTLRDLFMILGPHFDPYLLSLSERLFSKMANTNKFIKDDCEATLESMVEHCSKPKTIQILENVARRHKHSMIRIVAGRMITKFVGLVGPNPALEEYGHVILPLLCCNLGERTGAIREEARNAFRLLVPNPDFDAFMRHHVNPQFIYSICEKLERIREEVTDRPRIRRKVTRSHSLFKWQQKHTNTNLM